MGLPELESNEYYEGIYDNLNPVKCISQGNKLTCPLPNYDLENRVFKFVHL